MAEYLVTGGAGFIGSHLVDALVAEGSPVRVLDDFSSGKRANLEHHGSRIDTIEGDLRDQAAVARAMRGVRVVFHQAALTSVPLSMKDPARTDAVNAVGTRNVLDAARAAGAERVVIASTSALYGAAGNEPSGEESAGEFASPYAESKWVAEQHAEEYAGASGLRTVALRYFNVYGPRQEADSPYASVIPIFMNALLRGEAPTIHGDGSQTRDFIYIDDVVRANLLASRANGSGGAINIATGRSSRVIDLYEMIAGGFPNAPAARFGPPRAGDLQESRARVTRAKEQLGFAAEVSIRDGIARTLDWYRARGARAESAG